MKIYALLKQGYDGNETDGENIYQTSGSDVLKAISKEMYRN